MIKNLDSKNFSKYIVALLTLFLIGFLFPTATYANHFTQSKLFTGTEDLIADATMGASALIAVVAVVAIVFFQIRKAIADEMDHKKWDTRSIVAGIAFVIGVSAGAVIQILQNFYQ